MQTIHELTEFLEKLKNKKIYYRLNNVREGSIMVEVAIPGQRWEIEFNTYGGDGPVAVEIEKFVSDGTLYGKEELEKLFSDN